MVRKRFSKVDLVTFEQYVDLHGRKFTKYRVYSKFSNIKFKAKWYWLQYSVWKRNYSVDHDNYSINNKHSVILD